MASQRREQILAHLHLHAVLPTWEDLATLEPKASALVHDWNFALKIGVIGRPAAVFTFQNGRIHWHAKGKANLGLRFFSCKELNRFCANSGSAFPVLTGNLLHLPKLKIIRELADYLNDLLQPHPKALNDPAFCQKHATALLHVMVRSAAVLYQMDEEAKALNIPVGIAQFEIEGVEHSSMWLKFDGQNASAQLGRHEKPDVRITFGSTEVFLAAARRQLDEQAAVGLGEIRMNGLVPLAEAVSLLMNRIDLYLPPPPLPISL